LIAALTSLTLELVAATTADFNGDGAIDGADFLAWQCGAGVAEPGFADGDANGDGLVDGADLAIRSEQFGSPSGSAGAVATGVPEPNSLVLGVAAGCVLIPRILGGSIRRRRCTS